MELDFLEKNILEAIASSLPFPLSEVEEIYRQLKSFDMTIIILKRAIGEAVNPKTLIL